MDAVMPAARRVSECQIHVLLFHQPLIIIHVITYRLLSAQEHLS